MGNNLSSRLRCDDEEHEHAPKAAGEEEVLDEAGQLEVPEVPEEDGSNGTWRPRLLRCRRSRRRSLPLK